MATASPRDIGATRVVSRLELIGWIAWSLLSECIGVTLPCYTQNRKGLVA
jgi:hypothetical protein